MIRHPKPMFSSFLRILQQDLQEGFLDSNFVAEKMCLPFYEMAWNFYLKYSGRIILVEDLQEFPEMKVKEVYDYLGLEFKEEYLSYEPLSKIGIPEDLKYFQSWYKECFTSTEIKKSKLDLSSLVITNKMAIEAIEKSMAYYEKFVDASNKTIF